MEAVKLCKRGHERTPENLKKNGACKECARTRDAERRGTEEYKAYRATPEHRAYMANYKKTHTRKPENCQTAKYKARRRGYRQTAESRAYHNEYQKTVVIAGLKDSYIARRLGISRFSAPAELIEIKRLTIQLQRSLKNGNQI